MSSHQQNNTTAQTLIPPWEQLESGAVFWNDFPPRVQEKIVRHYAPKVKYLANRLRLKLPKNIELSELVSAGTLGLIESLGKFQPHLGIKFETYAENRIRGAMLDELRRLDWFPRSLRHRVRQLDEAMQRLSHNTTGEIPSEEALAELTGLSTKQVREGLEAMQNQSCLSLDALQEGFIPSKESITEDEPFEITANQELIDAVAGLVEQLTEREKMVLSLYYTDELNMRETASVLDITEGRVSQLHSQALVRLRKSFLQKFGKLEL
ncbi:FliA/WhiG family RNA polymerase sigma factor [Desulfovibrio litoralis]|uniref:RNA polymerase sigma factor n=1 Tax=Desulfovibrio litoralis DSM 11393 TaxID=1121455 RepID=A0A1M7TCV1_9BACT|nr:FliA/WhiG family RNA polymerase sigma factor [Desulfovibrio litoralis]SHN68545.1 RNA polymerase, sigma 28 subunit, SigD/FliA/WhiG [Desulfovibrio litoralis DSM 11393]